MNKVFALLLLTASYAVQAVECASLITIGNGRSQEEIIYPQSNLPEVTGAIRLEEDWNRSYNRTKYTVLPLLPVCWFSQQPFFQRPLVRYTINSACVAAIAAMATSSSTIAPVIPYALSFAAPLASLNWGHLTIPGTNTKVAQIADYAHLVISAALVHGIGNTAENAHTNTLATQARFIPCHPKAPAPVGPNQLADVFTDEEIV